MNPGEERRLRLIELGRAGWGLPLALAPRATLKLWRVREDSRAEVVARVLGARHLTQATLSGLDPSPEVLAMGVWVDSVHAATAVLLGVVDPDRRRAGFADAAVATTWALLGFRDLRRASSTPPRHQRIRDALAVRVLRHVPGGPPLLRSCAPDLAPYEG